MRVSGIVVDLAVRVGVTRDQLKRLSLSGAAPQAALGAVSVNTWHHAEHQTGTAAADFADFAARSLGIRIILPDADFVVSSPQKRAPIRSGSS